MTVFDAKANFALSTVAAAPIPANSGNSLTVNAGDGVKFPTAPFNCTVVVGSNPEIVRVTAISGDTFTILRAQENTSAQVITQGSVIKNPVTAKTLTDIEAAVTANTTAVNTAVAQMPSKGYIIAMAIALG